MWGRESLFVCQSIPLNGKSETFLFDAVLWFRFVKFFPILLLAFRLFFLLFFLSSIPSLLSTLWAQFWCLRRTFGESTYSTYSTIISWVSCCSCCRRLYIQAHVQFTALIQIHTPLTISNLLPLLKKLVFWNKNNVSTSPNPAYHEKYNLWNTTETIICHCSINLEQA